MKIGNPRADLPSSSPRDPVEPERRDVPGKAQQSQHLAPDLPGCCKGSRNAVHVFFPFFTIAAGIDLVKPVYDSVHGECGPGSSFPPVPVAAERAWSARSRSIAPPMHLSPGHHETASPTRSAISSVRMTIGTPPLRTPPSPCRKSFLPACEHEQIGIDVGFRTSPGGSGPTKNVRS